MPEAVRVTFVGDVMCKAQMLYAYRDSAGGYDFSPLFERMVPYFAKSDLTVANLETPVSRDNTELTTERFCFCSPREFADAVKGCGIGVVSTANNHCLDRGINGIESTVESLDAVGLAHTGVFADPARRAPLIVDVGGFRIGILSYTYGTNAFVNGCYLPKDEPWRVNLFQDQELSRPFERFRYRYAGFLLVRVLNKAISFFSENQRRPIYERRESSRKKMAMLADDIMRMRSESPDLVVMCMHAGGQYNPEATGDTKELAAWLLENGVDIVAGAHEHVVHGGDFFRRDRRVATYCLGNFDGTAGVFDGPFDKMAEYSIAWNLYLDPSQTGPGVISKMSFSVLKSVPLKGSEGGIQVVPAYDLYAEEKDRGVKAKLLDDVKVIVKRFSGKDMVGDEVEYEYELRRNDFAGE